MHAPVCGCLNACLPDELNSCAPQSLCLTNCLPCCLTLPLLAGNAGLSSRLSARPLQSSSLGCTTCWRQSRRGDLFKTSLNPASQTSHTSC